MSDTIPTDHTPAEWPTWAQLKTQAEQIIKGVVPDGALPTFELRMLINDIAAALCTADREGHNRGVDRGVELTLASFRAGQARADEQWLKGAERDAEREAQRRRNGDRR